MQAENKDVPIEVLVQLKKMQADYVVTVKDNGVGIPTEIKAKIFEPNFTTKNSGMGLGLAMVKKIINDRKGKINYTTSSSGTTFEFTIPFKN